MALKSAKTNPAAKNMTFTVTNTNWWAGLGLVGICCVQLNCLILVTSRARYRNKQKLKTTHKNNWWSKVEKKVVNQNREYFFLKNCCEENMWTNVGHGIFLKTSEINCHASVWKTRSHKMWTKSVNRFVKIVLSLADSVPFKTGVNILHYSQITYLGKFPFFAIFGKSSYILMKF